MAVYRMVMGTGAREGQGEELRGYCKYRHLWAYIMVTTGKELKKEIRKYEYND